jgi:exopolyphosphatase/guanosine-5'-triphosphate,3'-diphosphate pyrophosphatase
VALVKLVRRDPGVRADAPVGIIDIGSNSVRLVIYESGGRAPATLFNEKIMAGLGEGLTRTGSLDRVASDRAVAALDRFRRLAIEMGVGRLRTVATAAVREAANGPDFIARLAAMGLDVELISGAEEADLAAHGVLSGIPDADGIVGDLGGGSLELVRVSGGRIGAGVSVPFGVLRLAARKGHDVRDLDRDLGRALAKAGWTPPAKGLPFYLVGGSWRALARLHMTLVDHPLPIIHHYRMMPEDALRLVRTIGHLDPKKIRAVGIASSRVQVMGDAARLLAAVTRRLGSSELIVSAYGLREGLLHRDMPDALRAEDPLIAAARAEGTRQARFPDEGDPLARWIAPLFADEQPDLARLRHAACLLGDIAWRAHPDFRAERGLDVALHGQWVGIDAPGRAILGQALFTHFGGQGTPPIVARLLDGGRSDCAIRWGLAMRLGQRLSGGSAEALEASRIDVDGGALVLSLAKADEALYGEAVERRHKILAAAFDRKAKVRVV